jgi:hypothetical protein
MATRDKIRTIKTVLLKAIFDITAVLVTNAANVKNTAGPRKHKTESIANKI